MMAETENPSWQSQFSTLRERVEYAFNNSMFCDIEFTVVDSNGEKISLLANKFILSVSSPVFEAMFQGKLAEKGLQIDLPDCTKDGLQELLRFVHSDVVYLTGSNVMEVLYLSDKYMLPLLQDQCYEYLANKLTPNDVFSVLPQAQQAKNAEAEDLCWNVVDFETHKAVTSKAFLNISHDLLRQVLERETLHTDEINLFKAVDRWAASNIEEERKKENGDSKRDILGDEIVHLIRFPVMTQKEFADDVLVRDILKGNEVTEVVQIFSSITPSQSLFERVKRNGQWNEIWTENRFDAVDTKYCGDQQNHSIVFEVNKPVFLAGVRLFGVQSQSDPIVKLTSKLSLQKMPCKTALFHTRVLSNFPQTIDGLYSGHSVMIEPPILLLSKEKYAVNYTINVVLPKDDTISVVPAKVVSAKAVRKGRQSVTESFVFGQSIASTTSPPFRAAPNFTSYLGSGGKSVVHYDDIEIRFMNSEESNPGTAVEYGQFPSFLLKRKIILKKEQVSTNTQAKYTGQIQGPEKPQAVILSSSGVSSSSLFEALPVP